MHKELATFAAGCFWCTEAIFKELIGVEKVASGYSGGKIRDPTSTLQNHIIKTILKKILTNPIANS